MGSEPSWVRWVMQLAEEMPAGSEPCRWGELPIHACAFNLMHSGENKPRKNAGMSLTTLRPLV